MGVEEVGVKLTVEDEQAFYNAIAKAEAGVTAFDRALAKMAQQQENAAMLDRVKAKLEGMTEAEKFAAIEAVKMADETDRAAKNLDETGDSAEKASKGFRVAGLSLTDLKSGIDIVAGAAQKGAQLIAQSWEKTGGATMAYAAQVRELSRMSGASAENTSRLIQASDDLAVSYDDLKKASKAAADQGISLTVEKMAALQEQYQKIQDPAAKLDFLTKTFGKTGTELAKVLEVDATKFREMAASQSANLILTQKQIDQAREMEIAQDSLGDAFQGFAYVIGNAVMPVATDYLNALTDALTLGEKVNSMAQESATTYEDYKTAVASSTDEEMKHNAVLQSIINYYPVLAPIIRRVTTDTSTMTEEQWKANKALKDGTDKARFLSDEYSLLADQAAAKAAVAVMQLKYDQDKATVSMFDYSASTEGAARSVSILKAQQDALSKSYQDQISVGMTLAENNKKYQESYWELQNGIVTLTQSIDVLSRMKYRTPEQEKALADMRTDLGKQQEAMDALTKQHTIDTNKMIFNMLLQKAASDVLTTNEFANLMRIGVGMGLLTKADADMALALNSINLDDANATLDGFYSLLNAVNGGSTAAAGAVESSTARMNAINLGVARGEVAPLFDHYGRIQSASTSAAQEMEASTARMNAIRLGVARGELAPIDQLLRSIMSQPSTKTVDVYTHYHESHDASGSNPGYGGNQGGGAANGANYIVPAGFPNDSYLQPVSSGEHVIVLPAEIDQLFKRTIRAIGGVAAQSYSSSISNSSQNNYNLQVMTNQSPAVVQQSFAMMKMLAG